MATTIQRLGDIIGPIVDELGLELFDLDFSSSTVSVIIDKVSESGRSEPIDLSDITAVTRAVSRALDEHDPITERYSLEVSSPGLERPLRTPQHFERAVGQTLSVKTNPGVEGNRRMKGTLVRAGAVQDEPTTDEAGLAPDGTDRDGTIDLLVGGERCTIAYDDIDKARTVFEWGPEARPKKSKPPKSDPSRSAKDPKKPKQKKVDAS